MPKSDREILAKYIPENAIEQALELIIEHKINLNIKKARSTKLGDFRAPTANQAARLRINANLNPYAFLITLIHEIAHWVVWENYKNYRGINPHGIEWKRTFSGLIDPFLNTSIYPEDLLGILKKHMTNPKASTSSDIKLMKALKAYDKGDKSITLSDLSEGEFFILKNKHFQILKKNRTRFLCIEIDSNKKFLVHSLAEIDPVA